ncbi:MAG TPA: protoglobin domain-containing protein [Polyangia bacterium]
MPGDTYLRSLETYVGFTEESSRLLRAARPYVAPHVAAIIDDFYETIEAHPGARQSITGGEAQIKRLKLTLERWLDEMLLGPHDEAYVLRRSRIGRVHVRINLPQAYMFTAMNRMRIQVGTAIQRGLETQPLVRDETLVALHQIMDIELAIMLETYREDLEARNRTSERLATIGQLAAGIGHELRSPLGVVETSVFLLRQHFQQQPSPPDPKVLRHLDKISAEVKRSTSTIDDLLELARNRPPHRQLVSVRALIEGAVAAAHLPATFAVTIDAPANETARLDPDQITRVLTNVLINAGQAMEGIAAGRIEVRAAREGDVTRIEIHDTGPGIPVELRRRVFEALFTTKAKGTGLGLALCSRIAEAHGGSVTLEPSETGATFLITIPDAARAEEIA